MKVKYSHIDNFKSLFYKISFVQTFNKELNLIFLPIYSFCISFAIEKNWLTSNKKAILATCVFCLVLNVADFQSFRSLWPLSWLLASVIIVCSQVIFLMLMPASDWLWENDCYMAKISSKLTYLEAVLV